jgi:hypothetical protein
MTDDRRPRTPWVMWLFLAIAALYAARVVLDTVSRVVELVVTVGGLGVAAFAVWRLSAGRRDRRRP